MSRLQDGDWRPSWIYKLAITSQPVCRSRWCLVLGWNFRLSLDLFPRGLHTRTVVARNPCVSWVFLYCLWTGCKCIQRFRHCVLHRNCTVSSSPRPPMSCQPLDLLPQLKMLQEYCGDRQHACYTEEEDESRNEVEVCINCTSSSPGTMLALIFVQLSLATSIRHFITLFLN